MNLVEAMLVLGRANTLAFLASVLIFTLSASDISTILNRLVQGFADDETISELKVKIRTDPSALAWWAWLGYAHSLRGEWSEAGKAYQQAQQLNAKPSFSWFPPNLPISWLPDHGSLHPLTIGDLIVWQSPVVFCEPKFASDPKHGDRFHRIVFVYGVKNQSKLAQHLVHWLTQTGELPSHLSEAPKVFAANLMLFSKRFNMPLRFPVKGWLFAKGNGSAFSSVGHTLFYGSIPTDRWSWWLKIAHEAGHHSVPAFGEFDGLHEPYSGGFLGERLFATWIWDEGRKVWSEDSELKQQLRTYLLKVVSAEIIRAQQWLLESPKTKTPPMQVFLGLCLYLERLVGWELLRDAKAKAPKDSWDGFQVGLENAVSERLKSGLTIRLRVPDANTPLSSFDISALRDGLSSPSIQIAWWLPEGNFQCEVEVQGKGTLQVRWGETQIAQWNIDSKEPITLSCTFSNTNSGWQRLRFWRLKGEGKILSVAFRKDRERSESPLWTPSLTRCLPR